MPSEKLDERIFVRLSGYLPIAFDVLKSREFQKGDRQTEKEREREREFSTSAKTCSICTYILNSSDEKLLYFNFKKLKN